MPAIQSARLSRQETKMDKIKLYIFNFLALLIVFFFFYWIFAKQGQQQYGFINDFRTCVKAGYPVMESNPRRCRVPNGEIYVEPSVITQQCVNDTDCGQGKFCGQGMCQDFVLDSSCQKDGDCKLINKDLNFGCCWAGVCDPVDYSNPKWVAVSRGWFEPARTQACASQPACGTRPMCPAQLANDSYEARCVGGLCTKLPVRK